MRLHKSSHKVPMLWCRLIAQVGTLQRPCECQATSRCSNCPPTARTSTPNKTFGSTCARTWLSNRLFENYEDIQEACVATWRKLFGRPTAHKINRNVSVGHNRSKLVRIGITNLNPLRIEQGGRSVIRCLCRVKWHANPHRVNSSSAKLRQS